jgi:hypothetical protein
VLKVASFALQVATLILVLWLVASHPAPAAVADRQTWRTAGPA